MKPLQWLQEKLYLDSFVLSIIATVILASFFPAQANFAPTLDIFVTLGISLLFYLHGAKLKPQQALEGLKHWRLHLTILTFTFVLFPLVGWLLHWFSPTVITPELYVGILFLTLCPSTVQSSIAFTSMARGNVAGAIVSASASSLLGIFLTPALVIFFAATGMLHLATPVHIGANNFIDICLELLLPFILGQLSRPALGAWLERNSAVLKYVDRGSILLVVYSAFSEGIREHIWSQVSISQLTIIGVLSAVLVIFFLWLTLTVARLLSFNRADQITIQFCGTKKSLATGLPMATVIFAHQPVGIIVLPLMIFHQIQLMICSWLASRYSKKAIVPEQQTSV